MSLLENYTEIYDRSSEAACRIAVDFLLCECIAAMVSWLDILLAILLKHKKLQKGNTSTQPTDGRRTPTSWDSVKVHCEVSFSHAVNPISTIPKDIIVGGRVDHGVGIVIRSNKTPNRLFHSLLLCVESKFHGSLFNALAQLVVYLACLRQSRSNRGRRDTSVYGVATDGLSYVFVTITHEGVLKLSRQFDVMQGDLPTVLGCLQYILEMTMSMTPNSTPEKGRSKKSDEFEADADPPIDVDDNPLFPGHHDDEE